MSEETVSQLRRLEDLENSLKSMQTKIQYLLKEKQKNEKNVQKALKSSIGQIGSKMSQARFYEEMRLLHQKDSNKRNNLHDSIFEFKESQKVNLENIKKNIKEAKQNERKAIKQISKKNDNMIQENRRKNIQDKRNIVDQIKFLKEQTRRELQNKKEQRQRELQRERQEAIAARLRQKVVIEKKMKELSEMEGQLKGKIQQSQHTTRTIESIGNESLQIGKDQFYKIIRQVKKEKGTMLSEEELKTAIFEKFLKVKTSMSLSQIQQSKNLADTSTSDNQNLDTSQSKQIEKMN